VNFRGGEGGVVVRAAPRQSRVISGGCAAAKPLQPAPDSIRGRTGSVGGSDRPAGRAGASPAAARRLRRNRLATAGRA